jgi:hypothetical protein
MDGFEMAVFTSQLVDVAAVGGGRRRRRHSPVHSYRWHLILDERPLTWCGLEFSYALSRRRLWAETPEDQRCQSCMGRLERVNRTNTSQRTAAVRGEGGSDRP